MGLIGWVRAPHECSIDGDPVITTYDYSSDGRLLSVTTPEHTVTYRHNAFGNRVAKLVDGVITEKYLWENKTRLLATFDGNNNLKHSYEYSVGNTPTSYYVGNQRYYILTDQLGSPRIITDSAGNVLREIEYDSYGNIIADSNPAQELPFGFAGGLYDQHTGLIRFGFRDYDPETGRWTARDPIGFAGGDTNLYGYVLGDPVNLIDPTGEVYQYIFIGAVIGYGLYSFEQGLSDLQDVVREEAVALNDYENPEARLEAVNRVRDQVSETAKSGCLPGVPCAGLPVPDVPSTLTNELIKAASGEKEVDACD